MLSYIQTTTVFTVKSACLNFLVISPIVVNGAPVQVNQRAIHVPSSSRPVLAEPHNGVLVKRADDDDRLLSSDELRKGATSGQDYKGKYTKFADGRKIYYNDFLPKNFEEITKDDEGQKEDTNDNEGSKEDQSGQEGKG